MSLESIGNSNSHIQLQSALEAARQRTAPAEVQPKAAATETRKARSAGGSIFQKNYSKPVEAPQANLPQVGSQLDVYA